MEDERNMLSSLFFISLFYRILISILDLIWIKKS